MKEKVKRRAAKPGGAVWKGSKAKNLQLAAKLPLP
jgi:hypothetical protein